ncbi:hypothetical protein J0H58_29490 [bacterium]|nr:hypothetical protein [bacterium]
MQLPRLTRGRAAAFLVVLVAAGLVVAAGSAVVLLTHLAELAYLRLALRVTG